MPSGSFTIATYEVSINQRGPVISCHSESGEQWLIIIFYPAEEAPPENQCRDLNYGNIFCPIERYSHFLDLLRNEKPVFAFLNTAAPSKNMLYTGREPVGEEESGLSVG